MAQGQNTDNLEVY